MSITVVRFSVIGGQFIPQVVELHSVTGQIAQASMLRHLCEFYQDDISIRILVGSTIIRDYDPLALFAVWAESRRP